ncbi:MAG: hypothetical protein MdMp024_0045 [Bacteroidales bacterium]
MLRTEKKDAFYFSHDFNARNDPKILLVRMKHGPVGYAAYFMLLEKLREEKGVRLPLSSIGSLAFDFRIDQEIIRSLVEEFGLFEIEDEEFFYSKSMRERVAKFEAIRKLRKAAGIKGMANRWGNKTDNKPITTVIQNDNTIITNVTKNHNKEKKRKEKRNEVSSFRSENTELQEELRYNNIGEKKFFSPLASGEPLADKPSDTQQVTYKFLNENSMENKEKTDANFAIANVIANGKNADEPIETQEVTHDFFDKNSIENAGDELMLKDDELSDFEAVWNDFGKKGNRKVSMRRWKNLTRAKRAAARAHVPLYVASTPQKVFRKNFETYLNQEVWNDELPVINPNYLKNNGKGTIISNEDVLDAVAAGYRLSAAKGNKD